MTAERLGGGCGGGSAGCTGRVARPGPRNWSPLEWLHDPREAPRGAGGGFKLGGARQTPCIADGVITGPSHLLPAGGGRRPPPDPFWAPSAPVPREQWSV